MIVTPREPHPNDYGGGYAGDRQQDLKQGSNGYAGVVAAADNVVGVVQDRVVEPESRDRKDECGKEPGTHDPRGSLFRLGRRARTLTGSTAARAGHAL
jgi:hypothetical protein